MNLEMMHPRDQVHMIIDLIYKDEMTTTSGGNISVLDVHGNMWITPSAIDKGTLTPKDIVCVKKDGTIEGLHKPSSEFPFHRAIYECRPDLKAIIHAHPPALVSFSIVRKIPNTKVIPQAKYLCGEVGYAPYKLPGSEELGESIADEFKKGLNSVIMENHGTVVGGSSLFKTFQRFETLEFCARTIIQASQVGTPKYLSDEQIHKFEHQDNLLPEFEVDFYPSDEREIRTDICKFVKRACRQHLMISSYGTVSVRWKGNDFLITPTGIDRRHIDLEDIVQIKDGKREKGKTPSRSVDLHAKIYAENPEINSIILTQSPHATAYSIAFEKLDTHTIPESYILLKDIPMIPFGNQFKESDMIPKTISIETPIALLQNDSILVTGKSLLETFDRLEVAEFSAKSLISSLSIGNMVPIEDVEIEEIKKKFLS